MIKHITLFILAIFLFLNCKNNAPTNTEAVRFASYRDIPGITDDEIAAVEALRSQGRSFVHGMLSGTEAFLQEDGELRGFAVLFCEYLTELFGMTFEARTFEWDDLIAGLASGNIDFTGELTATQERRKTYFMTDPIALRNIKTFRIAGGSRFSEIAAARPLRFAFLDGATTEDYVRAVSTYPYEAISVDNYGDAYNMLKNGEIDAFLEENTAEYAFSAKGDIIAEHFFPLILSDVSMTTQNPLLEPIISVVQKVLDAGGRRYLTKLYGLGDMEFVKYKFNFSLTDDEREYMRARVSVAVAAETDNYPLSFFNNHEKQWQGVFIDILREVETLTGMTFEIINPPTSDWAELFAMLENGEAAMVSELIRTESREGKFLWPQTATLIDYFALLSMSSHPYVNVNEVMDKRVALEVGTAQEELFRSWFQHHANILEVSDMISAFAALERGDADLAMASINSLLFITHYMERPDFKINVSFDHTYKSFIGFNIEEERLCAIVDKALAQIDLQRIAGQWTRKTFDYRVAIAHSRLPWLIGASALFLCVIILLVIVGAMGRGEVKRLGALASAAKKLLRGDTEFFIDKIKGGRGEIKLVSSALEHAAQRIRVLTQLRKETVTIETVRVGFDLFVSNANCVSQAFKMTLSLLRRETEARKITMVYACPESMSEPMYVLSYNKENPRDNNVRESETFLYHKEVATLIADKRAVYLNSIAIEEQSIDFVDDKTQSVCVLSLNCDGKIFGYIILESECLHSLYITESGAVWQNISGELAKFLSTHEDAPVYIETLSSSQNTDNDLSDEKNSDNDLSDKENNNKPYHMISGLDVDSAVNAMGGDEEMYAEALRLFVRLLPDIINRADESLLNKDINTFAIETHSMRGALLNIGAFVLGNDAEQIENAAKSNDINFCHDNYPALKKSLDDLKAEIASAMPNVIHDKKNDGDINALKTLLEKAKVFADDFDTIECKKIVDEIATFSYQNEIDSQIEKIIDALERFDCEKAGNLVDKLIIIL